MKLKKFFALALAAATLALALTACGSKADDSADNSDANTDNQAGETVTVKLGVVGGIYDDLWAPAKAALADEGIDLEIVQFSDYVTPNNALANGDIEMCIRDRLWEGLGYYSRARNLQKAARVIVSDFGGELPRTCASLKTLPGIGDYTAAAIASINFGEPVAAVDGNLLRVAARVSGCGEDIMDARVRKQFTAHLNDAIDLARPGAYNQAMMDLGATVCLPNGTPKCEACPARTMCEAYKNGLTEILPVRAKKKARKIEERTVLLLFQNGKTALRKRADTGLLASLWEFPSVLGNLDEAGVSLALAQMGLSAKSIEPAGSAKHIFTHIEWDMKGYFADVTGETDDLFWADAAAFDAAAIPTAFKKFAALVRARLQ